jgi:hypothetical protein
MIRMVLAYKFESTAPDAPDAVNSFAIERRPAAYPCPPILNQQTRLSIFHGRILGRCGSYLLVSDAALYSS